MGVTHSLELMDKLVDLTKQFYECLLGDAPGNCKSVFYKIAPVVKCLLDEKLDYETYLKYLEKTAGYKIAETGVLITQIRNLFIDRKFLQQSLVEAVQFQNEEGDQ